MCVEDVSPRRIQGSFLTRLCRDAICTIRLHPEGENRCARPLDKTWSGEVLLTTSNVAANSIQVHVLTITVGKLWSYQ